MPDMDAAALRGLQRAYFAEGFTRPADFRIKQCARLKQAVLEYESRIIEALNRDMGRPATEAYTSEVMLILQGIDSVIRNIRGWSRPRRVRTSWLLQPGRSAIYPEPYGNVLIIGPWNYPFLLLLGPLVGAMAAGNTAVLKLSEHAEHSARVLEELVSRCFAPEYVAAVRGGAEESSRLLDQGFDYIFFTGSAAVGRLVMEKAARTLTPVTLELGGKNPCIVTPRTNLETAARRICWGKFFNAGQTCIAPDYLLIQESVADTLLAAIRETLVRFYGVSVADSADYGRIINLRHFHRLLRLMQGQEVLVGGEHSEAHLFIAPTVLGNVALDSPVMQEEIFGPILPLLTYRSLDDAIGLIRSRPKPLAVYVFTDDAAEREKVIRSTSSGSVNVNETLTQITSLSLPFGGVGESGMGRYNGRESFNTFTHFKSVLHRSIRFDNPLKYAPYRLPLGKLKRLLRLLG